MQTVFRVKRRIDEKQLSGLRIAKRRRVGEDDSVILTFAGTVADQDSESTLTVLESHCARNNIIPDDSIELNQPGKPEARANEQVPSAANPSILSDSDVENLFKIYDAHQAKIAESKAGEDKDGVAGGGTNETDEMKFVYDIYYVQQSSLPKKRSEGIDFNDLEYKLEHCDPADESPLVNETGYDEEGEDYEDDDSNAEDNPGNDYPDEEEWYSNTGEEIFYPHDEDYYGDARYDHLSYIEQQLQELSFRTHDDEC